MTYTVTKDSLMNFQTIYSNCSNLTICVDFSKTWIKRFWILDLSIDCKMILWAYGKCLETFHYFLSSRLSQIWLLSYEFSLSRSTHSWCHVTGRGVMQKACLMSLKSSVLLNPDLLFWAPHNPSLTQEWLQLAAGNNHAHQCKTGPAPEKNMDLKKETLATPRSPNSLWVFMAY